MGFSPFQAAIRKELNEFKSTEMEVHELSRHLTRLVSRCVFPSQVVIPTSNRPACFWVQAVWWVCEGEDKGSHSVPTVATETGVRGIQGPG